MLRILAVAALAALPVLSAAADGPAFTLSALREAARAGHPALAAARAQVEGGRAQVDSAAAYPNPELEVLSGRTRARLPGVNAGTVVSVAVTQRVDVPWQRDARIDVAGHGLTALEAGRRGVENELLARLDQRFYELLRREAEVRAAREDRQLTEQIRSRVAVRVETGEAPRYELFKADTELLNARKTEDSASLRVEQARAALRALVGAALPARFSVIGSLGDRAAVATLDALRDAVMSGNPDLARLRAEVARAARQLDLERLRRQPELAVKVADERDSELRDTRVGLVVSVPLWDRRRGPVAEAAARLEAARSELSAQELAVQQALEGAWRQYEITLTQVIALENGILREAEAALKVAEAAYRFGERGILDYLDAQRVFRIARNELIAARYDLQLAVIEIERLRAAQPWSGATP
ncbi:MAG TPA: TolC family protein [Rhodocyclaceae bacterium]|nr:TolC family protein [Rhodocyclaceae bacterium]HMV63802.1 TolC family protein [Rhodocyclaceae bacterium]HMW52726.1 TolC family protein [Rhodocyclaceae bacterium]